MNFEVAVKVLCVILEIFINVKRRGSSYKAISEKNIALFV